MVKRLDWKIYKKGLWKLNLFDPGKRRLMAGGRGSTGLIYFPENRAKFYS